MMNVLQKMMAAPSESSLEKKCAQLEREMAHLNERFGSKSVLDLKTRSIQLLRNRRSGGQYAVRGPVHEFIQKTTDAQSLMGYYEKQAVRRESKYLARQLKEALIKEKKAGASKSTSWLGYIYPAPTPKLTPEEKRGIQLVAHRQATELVLSRCLGEDVIFPSELKSSAVSKAQRSENPGFQAVLTVAQTMAGGLSKLVCSNPLATSLLGGLASLTVGAAADSVYETVCNTYERCITKNMTSVNPVETRLEALGACNDLLETCTLTSAGKDRVTQAIDTIKEIDGGKSSFSDVFEKFWPCLHEAHNCNPTCGTVAGKVRLGGPTRFFEECKDVSTTTTTTTLTGTSITSVSSLTTSTSATSTSTVSSLTTSTSSTSTLMIDPKMMSKGAIAGLSLMALAVVAFSMGLIGSAKFRSFVCSLLGRSGGSSQDQTLERRDTVEMQSVQDLRRDIARSHGVPYDYRAGQRDLYESPVTSGLIQRAEDGSWNQWSTTKAQWQKYRFEINTADLGINDQVILPDGKTYVYDGDKILTPVTVVDPVDDARLRSVEGETYVVPENGQTGLYEPVYAENSMLAGSQREQGLVAPSSSDRQKQWSLYTDGNDGGLYSDGIVVGLSQDQDQDDGAYELMEEEAIMSPQDTLERSSSPHKEFCHYTEPEAVRLAKGGAKVEYDNVGVDNVGYLTD